MMETRPDASMPAAVSRCSLTSWQHEEVTGNSKAVIPDRQVYLGSTEANNHTVGLKTRHVQLSFRLRIFMPFYNQFRLKASHNNPCSIDEFKMPPIKQKKETNQEVLEPNDRFNCNICNYYHPYSNCKSIKLNLTAFQQLKCMSSSRTSQSRLGFYDQCVVTLLSARYIIITTAHHNSTAVFQPTIAALGPQFCPRRSTWQ